ncbi:hypothetical protein [Bradyrhizobium valentinum]|uniref:hypothetical protein n=1 Tax=Bradyrhizobium valentinum TaxID=1518501 RepID=UPI000B231384|nr:hypothetical protein [Bradyrhizobium valentinum]
MNEELLSIDAPHFNAGVVIRNGIVVRSAPIIRRMVGWHKARVLSYCQRMGWRVEAAE